LVSRYIFRNISSEGSRRQHVRMARRVFSGPPRDQRVTPGQCVEAFHLQRTRFEMVAERKLRRRQLTEDGNVEITGRDLREKTPPVGQRSLLGDAQVAGRVNTASAG
jgi:hypothetical protein